MALDPHSIDGQNTKQVLTSDVLVLILQVDCHKFRIDLLTITHEHIIRENTVKFFFITVTTDHLLF